MSAARTYLHDKLSQGPWTQQPGQFGKDAIEWKMEIAPGVFVVLYSSTSRASVYAIRTINGQTKGLCQSTKIEYSAEGATGAIFEAIAATAALAKDRTAPKKKEAEATAALTLPAIPDFAFKKDRLAWLRTQLGTNIAVAYDCLLTILSNQTSEEQAMGATVEDNGVGFTGIDADILTSFARQLLKRRETFPGARLSPKQEALLLKKMPKYTKQYSGFCNLTVGPAPEQTPTTLELNDAA